jgi:hypothetical protein
MMGLTEIEAFHLFPASTGKEGGATTFGRMTICRMTVGKIIFYRIRQRKMEFY